jgi:hypothetical protein
MDWLDTYSDPSVKAASVVTNLWIAAFAITSALFALLGMCRAGPALSHTAAVETIEAGSKLTANSGDVSYVLQNSLHA